MMRSISRQIAWLCLLLTFWTAIAFVSHRHSNAAEAAQCKVCLASLSASPNPIFTAPKSTFASVCTLRTEPTPAKQRLIPFALSVRPPPEA